MAGHSRRRANAGMETGEGKTMAYSRIGMRATFAITQNIHIAQENVNSTGFSTIVPTSA